MKKQLSIFLCLIMPAATFALPEGDSGKLAENGGLSRKQVVAPVWTSAALFTAYRLSQFYFNEHTVENEYWIKKGLLMTPHIPMYFLDAGKGLIMTGIYSSLVAYDRYSINEDKDPFIRDFTGIWPMQHALFSTYEIYRHQRLRAAPGIYNDNWRRESFGGKTLPPLSVSNRPWRAYNFGELMLQPFDKNNIGDPFVYILPISGVLGTLLRGTDGKAIWNTGKAYIGGRQVKKGLAIPSMILFLAVESAIVATTEDSFFRGVVYEEIGHTRGQWWGKGVDMIAFPLFHVPGEIGDYSAKEITLNFLRRSVLTFYLDSMYDRGGLGRSVAAHFWIDFSLLLTGWLVKGGVPQAGLEDLMMGRELCIQVQMPF